MSANWTVQVPNPSTQMAWMQPGMARDYSIKLYALAGAVAVLLWDILLHIPQDYKILRNYRITFLTVVFFLSRLLTLVYILGLSIVTTAPIGNCALIRYVDYLYPFTLPFSLLIFVPRVAAIYHNNKYIIAFFTCTWLAVLATSILWPIGVQGVKIGPTKYCAEIKLHSTVSIATVVLLVHDSLIFLATSWAFMPRSYSANTLLKDRILGNNLPRFTKSILRDGQGYYLASLVMQVVFLSQYYVTSPFVFPCSFGNPGMVLTSNMAAYVYRNIRLGFYEDHTLMTTDFNHVIVRPNDRPQGLSIAFDTTEPEFSGASSVHSDEEKQTPDGRPTGIVKEVETKMDV